MPQKSHEPKVSIIYLTRNGGELFQRSLSAVLDQVASDFFEVIVVDSGSTDGTLEYLQNQPVRLYQIPPDEFNFGLTRDYAFGLAKGGIIVTLSQDAEPVGDNWLTNLVEPFVYERFAVVQGIDVMPVDREVFYWDAIGMFYQTRDCRKWDEAHDGIGMSFTNCAIRKTVWDENRLGRVEMSEDRVLQQKVTEKGHIVFRQMSAKVYHSHQYTEIGALAKRCMNEGIGGQQVGVLYTLRDLVLDLFRPTVWYFWLKGMMERRIRTIPEVFFPVVRPLSIFVGNRFSKRYVR